MISHRPVEQDGRNLLGRQGPPQPLDIFVSLKKRLANALAKTLIVPAIVSLLLFLVLTFGLFPLWQRYRNRYSQYLPLETISSHTLSLRARVQGAVVRFMAPSVWRARVSEHVVVAGRNSFDSDDGEELGAVDEATARAVLDQRRGAAIDSSRRLSRE